MQEESKELKDLRDYKRNFDYQTIYETRGDIANLNKEFTEIKITLASHFAKEEFRDQQLAKIVTAIEGNGKPGILSDIQTLFGYIKYITGGAAAIGIIWSIIVFVLPLLIK